MNFKPRISAAFLAVALTAISATSASDAQGIPEGQIEHTVTQRSFERLLPDYQASRPTVTEDWRTANASHSVERFADDGTLLRECASEPDAWSCFDTRGN